MPPNREVEPHRIKHSPYAGPFAEKPFLNAVLLETILPDDSRKAVQFQWPKSQKQNRLLYQAIPCSLFTNQATRHYCSSNAREHFSSIGFPFASALLLFSAGFSLKGDSFQRLKCLCEPCGQPTPFRRSNLLM